MTFPRTSVTSVASCANPSSATRTSPPTALCAAGGPARQTQRGAGEGRENVRQDRGGHGGRHYLSGEQISRGSVFFWVRATLPAGVPSVARTRKKSLPRKSCRP